MNKILIPIDFQRQSHFALEQSYNLARLLEAEIILIYVHEQSGLFAGIFSNDQNNEILSKIDEQLAEIAGRASLAGGIPISYRIEKGRIYSKIVEVAKAIDAQYIVMGTHSSEEDEIREKRVGANTSRVIRNSPCPVITINAKHLYPGCRHILLPLDLTKETRQKVTIAIELAKFYGAGIKAVSALWSKNDPAILSRLYQQGSQVTDFIASAGIECSFEVVESRGGEKTLVPSILNYAYQQGDIDLIIILTQQEIGIVEYFVGSHAQEFIRLSDIPVMSVIPKELGITSIFS
jgi:nucleotide-binding universal stress UspA family protein